MDRLPLRWTQSMVSLNQMGCSKCRIPHAFVKNGFFVLTFFFTQVVFQEERPSQGGGQGQGSNRGGIQETGAHKVRTRVCFHIWCNADQTGSASGQSVSLTPFFCIAVFQFCRGLHLFLFHPVCRSSFYKRSKVHHRLVCAF